MRPWLFLHPVLAVDADDRACLGLAHLHLWQRHQDKAANYRDVPIEKKESHRWIDAAQCWFRYLGHELETYLMPLAREHGSNTIQQIFEWYFQMGAVATPDEYRDGIKQRTAMVREWNILLDDCPLILSPYYLQPTPDWNCDARSFAETQAAFKAAIYSTGLNWLGLPCGIVPTGLVENRPAGVQIIGRRFREDLILDAMEQVEARVGVLTQQLWARPDRA